MLQLRSKKRDKRVLDKFSFLWFHPLPFNTQKWPKTKKKRRDITLRKYFWLSKPTLKDNNFLLCLAYFWQIFLAFLRTLSLTEWYCSMIIFFNWRGFLFKTGRFRFDWRFGLWPFNLQRRDWSWIASLKPCVPILGAGAFLAAYSFNVATIGALHDFPAVENVKKSTLWIKSLLHTSRFSSRKLFKDTFKTQQDINQSKI